MMCDLTQDGKNIWGPEPGGLVTSKVAQSVYECLVDLRIAPTDSPWQRRLYLGRSPTAG